MRHCFNSQPPEGGWIRAGGISAEQFVSTHSRPKAAGRRTLKRHTQWMFQLTAARRRLESQRFQPRVGYLVFQLTAARRRLAGLCTHASVHNGFNSQPPEGGWAGYFFERNEAIVSTHSRPKAAGQGAQKMSMTDAVSTHSRPKAAGWPIPRWPQALPVSTHSRPKAAGASAETLAQQGLHRPVSLRFHQKHMALL